MLLTLFLAITTYDRRLYVYKKRYKFTFLYLEICGFSPIRGLRDLKSRLLLCVKYNQHRGSLRKVFL